MRHVNYYIFGAIFHLLEATQLIDGIDFLRFDPDDEADVKLITSSYIRPTVEDATRENQETIYLTIAYYTTVGAAPFQLMRDWAQELLLADADSWELFFTRVGRTLYGADFHSKFDPRGVAERLNEDEGQWIFSRPA
jgi:hypothetical protein